MSATREDQAFYDGYEAGYLNAIADVRAELLVMDADGQTVPMPIYEMLNRKGKE